ncbi:SGNH/GDSL hydrolase family protein (plasmid) [Azospirillum oryzae]|uniref:SGNH/GDSL hydrolase family protein n=1 Tax=Azospirillum oryzae TaxID=286727 RepID=A0A6N1AC25_9PROT|nr:SGNH/GDSL hydrolase family protein [Azospirillum oryzae]KAA0586647.1 SGNH/GDSL hydrolase family protein [Azospirillum oryzae]QKS49093.1 SGNH/GDSL hydrolase family protein [Azospirillum oryzae]GLR80789.1 hypothetical protein GCM10007856_34690 [Azospirillum oryzae]
MSIAVVLPPDHRFNLRWLVQPLEAVRTWLGERFESVNFLCAAELMDAYRPALGTGAAVSQLTRESPAAFTEVFFIILDPGYPVGHYRTAPEAAIHTVDRTGAIRPHGRVLTEDEDPGMNAHVFTRLGPRDSQHAWAFNHFPWGYLYRDPSWGAVDGFGHRITADLRALEKRERTHKVVACYGGSAAWGWECLPHQVWTALLEERLNARSRSVGSPLRFTVLNFAGPGHVVLHQIFTHILHAHRLNPDVVITFDGINDLFDGQLCDPSLVGPHDIVYQEAQELWAQILHQSHDRARVFPPETDGPWRAVNQPMTVLRAYVARARQFRRMAEGMGAHFIWGVQPVVSSKAALSPEFEKDYLDRHADHRLESIHDNCRRMLDILSREATASDREAMVDHHALFRRFGAEDWLFWDSCHLTPEGNVRVADFFAEHMATRILPILEADGFGRGTDDQR